MEDKSLIRAWFTSEALYSSCEFFQAILYLIIYYFFLGYFTNCLLFCYKESEQPVYMARIHGFMGCNKIVLWNQCLWLVGLCTTLSFFIDNNIPTIFTYTVIFLLLTWSIQLANIYATQDLECKFSKGSKIDKYRLANKAQAELRTECL